MFEHSLVSRLVLFSLGITYVSLCKEQHIFVHAYVMARGGALEIIGRELRVGNHISETPKSPLIIIIYYHYHCHYHHYYYYL